MNNLNGQHVLILGLGHSGLAMARWCDRCGARVTVADTRAQPPQLEALQRELPDARFVHGALDASLLLGSDVRALFKSPGLAPAEVAGVVSAATLASGAAVAVEPGSSKWFSWAWISLLSFSLPAVVISSEACLLDNRNNRQLRISGMLVFNFSATLAPESFRVMATCRN